MKEMSLAEAVVITSWLSDDDFLGLSDAAQKIRAKTEDLALVLITESQMRPESIAWCPPSCGGGARPRVPYAVAVGLNQITASTAKANKWLGEKEDFQAWSKDFAKKKFQEQLPYLIEYFQNNAWYKAGKPYENATRVYLANAASGLIFSSLKDDSVVYGGDAAKNNPARASIGQLRAGLNYTMAHDPIWQASLIRLKSLGSEEMRKFLGIPKVGI